MATPAFSIQQVFLTVVVGTPNSFVIPVQNPAGDDVNISSGYTLEEANAAPQSDLNTFFPYLDFSAIGTFTLGNGSITWDLTAVQTRTLEALLPTLNSSIALSLSNDTGTTKALAAIGSLTLDHPVSYP